MWSTSLNQWALQCDKADKIKSTWNESELRNFWGGEWTWVAVLNHEETCAAGELEGSSLSSVDYQGCGSPELSYSRWDRCFVKTRIPPGFGKTSWKQSSRKWVGHGYVPVDKLFCICPLAFFKLLASILVVQSMLLDEMIRSSRVEFIPVMDILLERNCWEKEKQVIRPQAGMCCVYIEAIIEW